MIVPSLVKRETMFGTGYLPQRRRKTFIARKTANIWLERPKCRRWAITPTKFWTKICRKSFMLFAVLQERSGKATGERC